MLSLLNQGGAHSRRAIKLMGIFFEEPVYQLARARAVRVWLVLQQVVPALAAHICPRFVHGEEDEASIGLQLLGDKKQLHNLPH